MSENQHQGQVPPKPGNEKDELYFIFTLHDADKNGYLDGHELRVALTDFEDDTDQTLMSLEDVADMIDHVLEEDDTDGE